MSRGLVALQIAPGRWLTGSAAVSLAGLIYSRGGLVGPIVAQDVAVLQLARQLEYWQRNDSPTRVLSDAEGKRMLLEQFGVQAFLADLRHDHDLDF